jgi:hypothetical protein
MKKFVIIWSIIIGAWSMGWIFNLHPFDRPLGPNEITAVILFATFILYLAGIAARKLEQLD